MPFIIPIPARSVSTNKNRRRLFLAACYGDKLRQGYRVQRDQETEDYKVIARRIMFKYETQD